MGEPSRHTKSDTQEQNSKPPQETNQRQEFIGLIKSITIFLIVAFSLRGSVVEAFKIPSTSMLETLQVGDHILVNKLSYGLRIPFKSEALLTFRNPKRADVVVFTLPDDPNTPEIDETGTNIIKRVIGLPGDTIEVRGMSVLINGELYSDVHSIWLNGGRKDFGPVTVPENTVFLMGDNRDYSRDARYWDNPFLPISRIKGRAFVIYLNWPDLTRAFRLIR